MSCARFFSSSRSSSGRKPSVRNMLEGIPATASRWVSDLANEAISAQASRADLPSWEPLYANNIFLNMAASSFARLRFYFASSPSRSISARSFCSVSRAYFA